MRGTSHRTCVLGLLIAGVVISPGTAWAAGNGKAKQPAKPTPDRSVLKIRTSQGKTVFEAVPGKDVNQKRASLTKQYQEEIKKWFADQKAFSKDPANRGKRFGTPRPVTPMLMVLRSRMMPEQADQLVKQLTEKQAQADEASAKRKADAAARINAAKNRTKQPDTTTTDPEDTRDAPENEN